MGVAALSKAGCPKLASRRLRLAIDRGGSFVGRHSVRCPGPYVGCCNSQRLRDQQACRERAERAQLDAQRPQRSAVLLWLRTQQKQREAQRARWQLQKKAAERRRRRQQMLMIAAVVAARERRLNQPTRRVVARTDGGWEASTLCTPWRTCIPYPPPNTTPALRAPSATLTNCRATPQVLA